MTSNTVEQFDSSSTLATWLQDGGYETALLGKYMNGHFRQIPTVPDGWTRWLAFSRGAYYGYDLNDEGVIVERGHEPGDYSTDVLRDEAVKFIHDNAERPFFLTLNTFAPHINAVPAPRHVGLFEDFPPWRPPSFLEPDTSDKPNFVSWMRHLRSKFGPEVKQAWVEGRDRAHNEELASLRAVDDALAAMLAALKEEGLDEDTIIIFTSDNGLHWGEHWLGGKYNAYEESIRVPLVIRYPRMIRGGSRDDRLVLNIDLAPTLAELAGVDIPIPVDGESLVSSFRSTGRLGRRGGDRARLGSGRKKANAADVWREEILLEYFILFGIDAMPAYRGLRGTEWKYIGYIGGFEELYHLRDDPYELDNLLVTEQDNEEHRARADAMKARALELALD